MDEPQLLACHPNYAPRVIEGGRRKHDGRHDPLQPLVAGWPWVCDHYRIWWVLDGKLTWEHGNDRVELSTDDIVFHAPDPVPSRMYPAPMSRWAQLRFSVWRNASGREPSPFELWGVEMPPIISAEHGDALRRSLNEIMELWWRDRWSLFRADTMLALTLAELAQTFHYRQQSEHLTSSEDRFSPVDELLAQRPMASVPEMARVCAMSERNFRRRFSEARGVRPTEYARKMAVSEGRRRLLEDPTRSVLKVAREVGYETANAFILAFRKEMGTTPECWRRAWAKDRG